MAQKKFDTHATTTYLVRLTGDAKVFDRLKDGEKVGEDVVLTFIDTSWLEDNEDMWVDARVVSFLAGRAKRYRKGDEVQVSGKLRFKRQKDGTLRGKIYDAHVASFVKLSEREDAAPSAPVFE